MEEPTTPPYHPSYYRYRQNITSVYIEEGVKAPNSISYLFSFLPNCTSMNLNNLDTSNSQIFDNMFNSDTSLKEFYVSALDTSNVTSMANTFLDCTSLETVDLKNWDVSNVTNMQWMFDNCSSLTSLDLSSWDVSNIYYFNNLFYGWTGGTSLDLSSFDTKNATNMNNMFYKCTSLGEVTLGSDFYFNGTTSYLPTPTDEYFPGTNGTWVNTEGVAYAAANIPSGVADTYRVGYDATITYSLTPPRWARWTR